MNMDFSKILNATDDIKTTPEMEKWMAEQPLCQEVGEFLTAREKAVGSGYAQMLLDIVQTKYAVHKEYKPESPEFKTAIEAMTGAASLASLMYGLKSKELTADLQWLEGKSADLSVEMDKAFPDMG
jgi:hypothetical protein